MLLAILPSAFILLTIRVVQGTLPTALIILELTLVRLSIRPQVSSLTVLLAVMESAEEEPTVWPLEQAITVHRVVQKGTLVDLPSGRYASAEPVDLTLFVEALKDGVVRVYFESHAIGSHRVHADLASVLGATASLVEIQLEFSLCVHVIINIMMQVVVKGSQNFVDVTDVLVCHLGHHVGVVAQSEVMVQFDDVAVQSLTQIDHDVFLCLAFVFHYDL